jgi:D-alanine-D-alanine ligase
MNALDKNKYDVYLIDIHPTGWWYENIVGEEVAVDRADFSIMEGGLKINFDIALMCIHGTPGEDGKLQGYFDCLGIPYTSCNAASSALTFNKRYTVAVAAFAGIPVAKSIQIFKHSAISTDSILSILTLPVFVKPNNGGSSFGISKVKTIEALQPALDKAFAEDEQVLVEEFISGREFTIGVFKSKGEIIALPITEIITENEFFDYQAKYEGASQEVTPAQVEESIAEQFKDQVKKYNTKIYILIPGPLLKEGWKEELISYNCTGETYMKKIFEIIIKIKINFEMFLNIFSLLVIYWY